MTKAEYIKIKSSKTGFAACSHGECVDADVLIKRFALRKLSSVVRKSNLPKPIADWVMLSASVYFGSGDVDEMLMAIKAYPKWM